MVTPTPDDVTNFMRITGATEFVAVQKLEEYGGDLNDAINAYFLEGDTHIPSQSRSPEAEANVNSQSSVGSPRLLPFLNAVRRFRPSLLLDSNYRRELRDLYNGVGSTAFTSHAPHTPLSEEARAGIDSAFEWPHHQSGSRPTPAHVTGNLISHGRVGYGTAGSDNDLEEEMVRAAIEASKKDSSDDGLLQSHFQQEDGDLAQALALSLKMAEQEKAKREQQVKGNREGLRVHDLVAEEERTNSSRSTSEWGGISFDELNEALMVETALFSSPRAHSSLPDDPVLQHHPEVVDPDMQCSSSSKSQLLTDTQLLRQQKDAIGTNCLKEDESCKEMLEIQDLEKMHDKKEVRLPKEPSLADENAIAIIVRMPDGSRCECRFLKTDKLQLLFDFIDTHGAVKPGTYRVVKSYPRRAFGINDSGLTLNEVGLSSKNEALFLELI